ncbi:MAG TPA: MFS transporter [Anoxybacillus sp.]|jgi:MFS transporter, DHA3 family, macrolide efflux protein|nr:MFS transporter [Anoxybacillus sp.]
MNSNIFNGNLWNSNFTNLFLSRIVKVTGDNFALISLMWLIIEMGEGAIGVALLLTVTILPQALLGPIISPLMQKKHLARWMFYSDIIRAIIIASIPLLYSIGLLKFWLLLIIVIFQSATGSSYNPASVAIIPQIVIKNHIQKANAILQSSYEIVTLISVTVAGFFVSFSIQNTLLITGILFFISAVFARFIKQRNEDQEKETKNKDIQKESYIKKLAHGFKLVKNHRLLFALTLYAIFMNIGLAPWSALSAVFVSEILESGASVHSLIRGTTAVGALLMGLLLSKVDVQRYGLLFILAGIVEGLAFLITGLSTFLPIIFICAFIFGMTVSAVNVPELVIIQTSVSEEDQPQVYAIITMLSVTLIPISYIISGYLANYIGIGKVIALGGLIEFLAGVYVLLFSGLAKMKNSVCNERDVSI